MNILSNPLPPVEFTSYTPLERPVGYIPSFNLALTDFSTQPSLIPSSPSPPSSSQFPMQLSPTPLSYSPTSPSNLFTPPPPGLVQRSNIPTSPKTEELLSLFEKNGVNVRLTSGYRPNSRTAQGHVSHHSSTTEGAIDIVPIAGQTFQDLYQQIQSSPEIIEWMIQNNYGILDETSPETMRRTGATGPHWHIGKDKLAVQQFKEMFLTPYAKQGMKIEKYQRGGPSFRQMARILKRGNIAKVVKVPQEELPADLPEDLPLEDPIPVTLNPILNTQYSNILSQLSNINLTTPKPRSAKNVIELYRRFPNEAHHFESWLEKQPADWYDNGPLSTAYFYHRGYLPSAVTKKNGKYYEKYTNTEVFPVSRTNGLSHLKEGVRIGELRKLNDFGEQHSRLVSFDDDFQEYKKANKFLTGGKIKKYQHGKKLELLNKTAPNFIQRLNNPNPPVINNPDGTFSTHLMSWATRGKDAVIFPTIQESNGRLVKYTDWKEALDSAMKNNDTLMTSPRLAKWYTKNYKKYYPKFQTGGIYTTYEPPGGYKRQYPGAWMSERWYNSAQVHSPDQLRREKPLLELADPLVTPPPPDPTEYIPSREILDFILAKEGFRSKIHIPTKGDRETIGFGTTRKDVINKYRNREITREEALQYFHEDVEKFAKNLSKTPNWKYMNQNQRDALLSLYYNIGHGNFFEKSPKLQDHLKAGDWKAAAKEMDHDMNNPDRKGQRIRRLEEQEWFLKPYYD